MRSIVLVVVATVSLAACKKSSKPESSPAGSAAVTNAPVATGSSAAPAAAAASGDPACLVGGWVADENLYTFKADKTGERIHENNPPVAFTWSMKDPKTAVVVFPEHGDHGRAEFQFTVDCSIPQIKFQDSIPFVKQ